MKKTPDKKEFQSYLSDIFTKFPVGIAYLYGSYANGTQSINSDIDIALVFKNNLSPLKRLKIEMQIASILEKKFQSKFDIRGINDAPLRVKGEIITHGQLIYCSDENFRISFETFIRDRYFDFLPILHSMRRIYFTSIKTGGLIG
ncbi:MAG: type VII toxin-antitoxin system MntA family adenylyltransferase antitoxin [Candidatus Aminicenantaceae bacterium]